MLKIFWSLNIKIHIIMRCVVMGQHSISMSFSGYKGTILQRNHKKMTILWSFSYKSFVKFHLNNILEPQYQNPSHNEV